jgi:hypothetical protein
MEDRTWNAETVELNLTLIAGGRTSAVPNADRSGIRIGIEPRPWRKLKSD